MDARGLIQPMKYKLFGPTGLRISDIGLGTLNFGEAKDWGVSQDEAHRVLGTFAEAGGTLIDTAPNYARGAAETIVGTFLKGQRDRFVLSTKYTASNDRHVLSGGNSARTMIRSVESSLERLGTDHIDILWLHYWDGTTPLTEILSAFDRLRASGKVAYFGFSDTPAWLVSRAVTLTEIHGWPTPGGVQVEYNLAARDAERELMPMADALGLTVFAWGPLAAGALTNSDSSRRRSRNDLPTQFVDAIAAVQRIVHEAGISSVGVLLRWLMGRPTRRNIVPLLGARTAEQLTDALTAAQGSLTLEQMSKLDALMPPTLGFPHDLIASPYLQKLAFGSPDVVEMPIRPRA